MSCHFNECVASPNANARTRLSSLLVGVSILTLALATTACGGEQRHADGPAERAGESVDEAAEDANEAADEAAEEAGDAVEDATD